LSSQVIADKIPHFDHVFHAGMVIFHAAAGAVAIVAPIAGASDTGWLHITCLVIGAVLAGLLHLGRAALRLLSTATTGGAGNPCISIAEDVIVFVLCPLIFTVAVMSVFVAIAVVIALPGAIYYRQQQRNEAVAREAAAQQPPATTIYVRYEQQLPQQQQQQQQQPATTAAWKQQQHGHHSPPPPPVQPQYHPQQLAAQQLYQPVSGNIPGHDAMGSAAAPSWSEPPPPVYAPPSAPPHGMKD